MTLQKKNISLNIDWLYQLWKSEKIKIFTITYDGVIREMSKDDWNFLSKVSYNDTDVQKNKASIFCNILKVYGFTTEEFTDLYNPYRSIKDKIYNDFESYLRRKDSTQREIQYANIIKSMRGITNIDNSLYGNIDQILFSKGANVIQDSVMLCLFERNDVNPHSNQMRIHFSDKYNIAKYFPGYVKNKELWDYLKTRWLNKNEFYGVVNGSYTYKLIKQQSTLEEF